MDLFDLYNLNPKDYLWGEIAEIDGIIKRNLPQIVDEFELLSRTLRLDVLLDENAIQYESQVNIVYDNHFLIVNKNGDKYVTPDKKYVSYVVSNKICIGVKKSDIG